jgi:hypothetical protein
MTPPPTPTPRQDNACILNSIIGWRSRVGFWSRIQGTYGTFDENMFDAGKKNPGVTCIGTAGLMLHTIALC